MGGKRFSQCVNLEMVLSAEPPDLERLAVVLVVHLRGLLAYLTGAPLDLAAEQVHLGVRTGNGLSTGRLGKVPVPGAMRPHPCRVATTAKALARAVSWTSAV